MFHRQAVNSLEGDKDHEDTPRPRRFLRRRSIAASNPSPSPAKRFLSLLKLGLTPSKKASKKGWKPSVTTLGRHSSPTAPTTVSNDSKGQPSSYAAAVTSKDDSSLFSIGSPLSSLSSQSELGITNLPGWTNATDAELSGYGEYPMPPLSLPPSPSSWGFSPGASATPRRSLFRRQLSHSSLAEIMMSPNYLDRSQDMDQDINSSHISQDISDDHYDFDLNHHYDFDLDEDLATERYRYLKGKTVHIDGVEITPEEEEFTKSFNRIKLDRRPRRDTNRRKAKHSHEILGKKEDINDVQNLHL